ncbi:MAG: serine hydrolase domain-containing protein [Sphingomonas sp.]
MVVAATGSSLDNPQLRHAPSSRRRPVLKDAWRCCGSVERHAPGRDESQSGIAGHLVYPTLELGAAYDKAMQTQIFGPLGMTNTTFDIRRALSRNHASPHFSDLNFTPMRASIGLDYGIVAYRPAGGAWSSAHDMIKYVQLELTKGVLPDGRRLVSAANLLQRRAFSVPVGEDAYYGKGLMIDTGTGVEVIHHGGTMPGYASDIFAIPDAQVGAVILTNSDEGQLLTRPFMRRLLELLYDGHPEATGDVTAVAGRVRAQLGAERANMTVPPDAGVVASPAHEYRNPELGNLTVTQTNGAVRFDFGTWGSAVASRRGSDGSASLVLLVPPGIGYDFIVGDKAGQRTLTLRDGQHQYVYIERR